MENSAARSPRGAGVEPAVHGRDQPSQQLCLLTARQGKLLKLKPGEADILSQSTNMSRITKRLKSSVGWD